MVYGNERRPIVIHVTKCYVIEYLHYHLICNWLLFYHRQWQNVLQSQTCHQSAHCRFYSSAWSVIISVIKLSFANECLDAFLWKASINTNLSRSLCHTGVLQLCVNSLKFVKISSVEECIASIYTRNFYPGVILNWK